MKISRFSSQVPLSRKYKKVAKIATRVQTKNERANKASAERLKERTMTSIVNNNLLEYLKALKTLKSLKVLKIEKWKKFEVSVCKATSM